jgi:FkbM family methyltransferase
MSPPERQDFRHSLLLLFTKGIRYSTVIDVGCADGNFFLELFHKGVFSGAVPLNIDANACYEDSLRAIQKVVGGHYRICAVTDHVGSVEIINSVHPYWSSLLPEDNLYWERVNKLSATKSIVPATTLDTLKKELELRPPFLLKLDVQGSEKSALQGAAELLQDTNAVICEADIDDFQDINVLLREKDFVLYDITRLDYAADGTFGWFHPVYINQSLNSVRPKSFWDAATTL